MEKGKSSNGLMRHIRNDHQIIISGSPNKIALLNMGYYHGYKRYRYIKFKNNLQPLTKFSEIEAIHAFDFQLKVIFYPLLIMAESGMKNRTIESLVNDHSPYIEDIYQDMLTDYLDHDKNSSSLKEKKKYKDHLKDRLKLRTVIDETIGYNYGKSDALSHYVHNNKPIPLWAFFEVISFGQFGHFISSLNLDYRLTVADANNLSDSQYNHDGRMLERIVFTLTGLRNATMHDSAIFDANFNSDGIATSLKCFLSDKTMISNITFDTIIDYFILLMYLLKWQGYEKQTLLEYVSKFECAKEALYFKVPKSTFGLLNGMDSQKKINQIRFYISN